jgi:hypothetical protein
MKIVLIYGIIMIAALIILEIRVKRKWKKLEEEFKNKNKL